jgi:hypothetical protein
MEYGPLDGEPFSSPPGAELRRQINEAREIVFLGGTALAGTRDATTERVEA